MPTPKDRKGGRLRGPSSPAWIALGKELGGNPKPMRFGKACHGLKTGVVQGLDNPIPTDVTQRVRLRCDGKEVLYGILTQHGEYFIQRDVFDSLEADTRLSHISLKPSLCEGHFQLFPFFR